MSVTKAASGVITLTGMAGGVVVGGNEVATYDPIDSIDEILLYLSHTAADTGDFTFNKFELLTKLAKSYEEEKKSVKKKTIWPYDPSAPHFNHRKPGYPEKMTTAMRTVVWYDPVVYGKDQSNITKYLAYLDQMCRYKKHKDDDFFFKMEYLVRDAIKKDYPDEPWDALEGKFRKHLYWWNPMKLYKDFCKELEKVRWTFEGVEMRSAIKEHGKEPYNFWTSFGGIIWA